jgi:uncharacterized membrane protein
MMNSCFIILFVLVFLVAIALDLFPIIERRLFSSFLQKKKFTIFDKGMIMDET